MTQLRVVADDLPEGWRLVEANERQSLESELAREVTTGHVLQGLTPQPSRHARTRMTCCSS
ncbi:hypothetical protein ACFSC4_09870 [Deinococcus malanensis]|uniref:hypothetical protein n=1 Tax=Deinococcus malanensis TaxID=1706855 RepID=UPI0036352EED